MEQDIVMLNALKTLNSLMEKLTFYSGTQEWENMVLVVLKWIFGKPIHKLHK